VPVTEAFHEAYGYVFGDCIDTSQFYKAPSSGGGRAAGIVFGILFAIAAAAGAAFGVWHFVFKRKGIFVSEKEPLTVQQGS
jgi:hypothetical protein